MKHKPREPQKPYKGMHPQDVQAAIRKQYGSVAAFHRKHGLPTTAVFDVLRGRASAVVERAIDDVLRIDAESKKLERSSATA